MRTKGNRYIKSREADLVPGVIRMNRQGKGFLQPDEPGQKEIVIPENATSTALHGDRVLVRRDVQTQRVARRAKSEELTGSVVRILERKRAKIVGTLQQGRQFLYVIPDDPRIPHDIMFRQPRDVGRPANIGDKVVVELRDWESRHTNPEGEIIEVLGAPDEEGVDMLSVLRQYDLPLHFPKPVLHEANAIAKARSQRTPRRTICRACRLPRAHGRHDRSGRREGFRRRHLSATGTGDRWKLWVHIADVSHYVKTGNALDLKRANAAIPLTWWTASFRCCRKR